MKTAWLRKEGAEELLVFFNGWGMDHRIAAWLLRESLSAGFSLDMLACYDYHTLETEEGFMNGISGYSRITVVAWSFGGLGGAAYGTATYRAGYCHQRDPASGRRPGGDSARALSGNAFNLFRRKSPPFQPQDVRHP